MYQQAHPSDGGVSATVSVQVTTCVQPAPAGVIKAADSAFQLAGGIHDSGGSALRGPAPSWQEAAQLLADVAAMADAGNGDDVGVGIDLESDPTDAAAKSELPLVGNLDPRAVRGPPLADTHV